MIDHVGVHVRGRRPGLRDSEVGAIDRHSGSDGCSVVGRVRINGRRADVDRVRNHGPRRSRGVDLQDVVERHGDSDRQHAGVRGRTPCLHKGDEGGVGRRNQREVRGLGNVGAVVGQGDRIGDVRAWRRRCWAGHPQCQVGRPDCGRSDRLDRGAAHVHDIDRQRVRPDRRIRVRAADRECLRTHRDQGARRARPVAPMNRDGVVAGRGVEVGVREARNIPSEAHARQR